MLPRLIGFMLGNAGGIVFIYFHKILFTSAQVMHVYCSWAGL